MKGAPDVETLSDTRTTYVKYEDGEVVKITDDLKDPANTHKVLDKPWQGATAFSIGAKASTDVKVGAEDSFEPTPKPKDWLSQEELMRQANTTDHLYGHRVFNPYCKHCCRAKAQQTRRVKGTLDLGPAPKQFGDQTTGDHLITRGRKPRPDGDDGAHELFEDAGNESDGSNDGREDDESLYLTREARDAVVMYDRATGYGDMFPKATKSAADTLEAFREWTSGEDVIKSFYADNAPELRAAAREMKWRLPTSTPAQTKNKWTD